MSDKIKISELEETDILNDQDVLMLIQNGVNKKIKMSVLIKKIISEMGLETEIVDEW